MRWYMSNNRNKATNEMNSDSKTSLPLPPELIDIIASFLDIKSISKSSRVCSEFNSLFKRPLALACTPLLLQQVMQGDENNARLHLNHLKISSSSDYAHAILNTTKGTDPAGRQCKASPLEYAAWAGDSDMVNMLLSAIPDEYTEIALAQLRGVKNKGIKINGEYEEHLSAVKPLIDAYMTYLAKNFKSWKYESRDSYWVNEIGMAQRCAPINLLQWFYSPISFDLSSVFENALAHKFKNRPLLPSTYANLGSTCAIYKVWQGANSIEKGAGGGGRTACRHDLDAVLCFYKVRSNDLTKQISQLEDSLQSRHRMEF
jgi:hypothetical protein